MAATEPKIKKFDSIKEMNGLMRDYFLELWEASRHSEADHTGAGGDKIAWCTSVGPVELLRALGFKVFFPENHAAMLGAGKLATDLIPKACAAGYSPDICSYLTSDIGAYLSGITPLTKVDERITSVPRPDILVYNTNQCRDVYDWFHWYARQFRVPIVGVQTYRGVGEVTDIHIKGIADQLQHLVPLLEEIAGHKFDIDRLREVLRSARRCSDLWKEVLTTAAHTPSPMTFFDATVLMGPAVVLRGDERANAFYERLLQELRDRIRDNISAVDGEHFRLYWDGMPIWGKLRDNATLFLKLSTCVVASTYCNSWIFAFDPDRAFESMARAYTELFIVRTEGEKEKYIDEMIRLFRVDGLIFHDAKTCPNNSNNRYGMPERYRKDKRVPTLVINGDLSDLRCYSEEQTKTSIEAFVEQLSQEGVRHRKIGK